MEDRGEQFLELKANRGGGGGGGSWFLFLPCFSNHSWAMLRETIQPERGKEQGIERGEKRSGLPVSLKP